MRNIPKIDRLYISSLKSNYLVSVDTALDTSLRRN